MKAQKAVALIHLTRYQEYLLFVTTTTLLGFIFSNPEVHFFTLLRLLIVHVANMLSVCFSFMINDVEDAPDDALNPKKVIRNPISAGKLSSKTGFLASLGIAGIAIVSFFPLGPVPFGLGLATILLGFLYSWKPVRLKNIPLVDLVSHGLMLAGLQFLSSYFTFSTYHGLTPQLVLPFLLVVSISMHGELYNEVRDYTYDRLAGLKHTAALIGLKATHIVMYGLLAVAISTIAFGLFLHLIPLWFVVVYVILGSIFFTNFISSHLGQEKKNADDVQQYILVLTTVALFIWFVVKIVKFFP